MTALEAITDQDIKDQCLETLGTRYDRDVLEDAWQSVCEKILSRHTNTIFPSWEKARNYMRRAVNNRAKDIYNHLVMNVAESADEFMDEDSPAARVPDASPNILELCEQLDAEALEEAIVRERAFEVRRVIAAMPPVIRETLTVMLKAPHSGLWNTLLRKKFKLSKEEADSRIQMAKSYQDHFEHLRGRGAPRRPSERRTTETGQTAA